MSLTEKGYKKRLIDDKIERYLDVFGAISIEGAKWCGKTWTALNHAESVSYVTETNIKKLALINPKNIFTEKRPQLIDEWQIVPSIWDSVRHECDRNHNTGKFILTGSTTLRKDKQREQVHHSGAGRIARMKMQTMSLYESGDSNGEISLTDMFEGKKICKTAKIKPTYEGIAKMIVRGGWPENLSTDDNDLHILPQSYINAVLESDISKDGVLRDKNKMRMLLKSLARNESTIVSNNTLIRDIEEVATDEEYTVSRNTIADYLNILENLYLLENQEAYTTNLRSKERVGKSSKRHFTDPSLACAILSITPKILENDIRTFGLMFEALVERDLRIYIESLDGKLYHYRNNNNGVEVDAIVELPTGEFGAIEIKLGTNEIESAKESLTKFSNEVKVEPKFKCIICGLWDAVVKDEETGIYIIPITALKP